jgi:colicin import membrane protein
MIGTPLAQKVLRLEYSLLRAPLGALETRLSRRPRLRLPLERVLAASDAAAGRLLGDSTIARRGETLREHADVAARAVTLSAEADQLRQEADEVRERGVAEADRKRNEARRTERQRVAEALEQEEQEEREAEARARAEAAEKKRAADARAQQRRNQATASRTAKDQQVRARTERATAPAKSALKESAKVKAAADERRADANTLSELADTEKQTRRKQTR